MSQSNVPVSEVTDIAQLRSEVSDILRCVASIEHNEIQDNRSFTSLDVAQSMEVVKTVIDKRLAGDNLVLWRRDDQNEYVNLFNSICEEIKLSVTTLFIVDQRRPPRFVHTFNNLVVERIVQICKVIGPSGSKSLLEPLTDQFMKDFYSVDDFTSVEEAQQTLQKYRREVMVKRRKFKNRLELIQHLFEQVQVA